MASVKPCLRHTSQAAVAHQGVKQGPDRAEDPRRGRQGGLDQAGIPLPGLEPGTDPGGGEGDCQPETQADPTGRSGGMRLRHVLPYFCLDRRMSDRIAGCECLFPSRFQPRSGAIPAEARRHGRRECPGPCRYDTTSGCRTGNAIFFTSFRNGIPYQDSSAVA